MTQIILFDCARDVNEWLAGEGLCHTIKDIKLIDGRQRTYMIIYEKALDK